jgi:large subunit ribosomal protein L23
VKKKSVRVIRRPIITERASQNQEVGNKYLFEVRKDANKVEIRKAVEEMFTVKVAKVNTASVRGKTKQMGRFRGRKADWKKAIVTVAEGQSIEFFEGV